MSVSHNGAHSITRPSWTSSRTFNSRDKSRSEVHESGKSLRQRTKTQANVIQMMSGERRRT